MIFRRFAAVLALISAPVAAFGVEPAIIAKARSFLGTEAALNAVKSVRYTGTISAPNPTDPAKPVTGSIDIIFQSPYRQRTVRTAGSLTDVIALDDYDGWHRVQDSQDPAHWRMQVLPSDEVRRQRAVVLENLTFLRGLERAGGQVVDQGSTSLGGVACRKIAFIHSADVIFYRYFDEATGQLLLSETEGGNTIREQGEIRVNGIRFPKALINTTKSADGSEHSVVITIDAITLNEVFPNSTFAIPSLSGK